MAKNISVNDSAKVADVLKAVKGSERILRTEILRVEEKVEKVEDGLKRVEEKLTNKMDGLVAKLDKISNQLDGFVGRVDDLTNDNLIGTDQIHQIHKEIKDHEKRIKQLESPTQ